MRVGGPKRIKNHEYGVGLSPAPVAQLAETGHELFVKSNAGRGIECPDGVFGKAGAAILAIAAELFAAAKMIVKINGPPPAEDRAAFDPAPDQVQTLIR